MDLVGRDKELAIVREHVRAGKNLVLSGPARRFLLRQHRHTENLVRIVAGGIEILLDGRDCFTLGA